MARDRLDGVLGVLQSQVADIAAVQKEQAALRVEGRAAQGTVEVTVDARGQLVNVVIDKAYLDGHDVDELGGYVLEAVQAAVGEVGQRVVQMLASINERDESFPTFSDIIEDISELRDVMAPELADFAQGAPWKKASRVSVGSDYDDGDDDGAQLSTLRELS